MKKRPLIILARTYGSRKNKSIHRACKTDWRAEIISADSMQVYRHMDIGSAKITTQRKWRGSRIT